jgi:hypothetical protein
MAPVNTSKFIFSILIYAIPSLMASGSKSPHYEKAAAHLFTPVNDILFLCSETTLPYRAK